MKRATKIAVAVGLALGLGTAVVVAQPYGMGMMGGGGAMMMGGGMMGGGWGHNVDERLAAQKSGLKIVNVLGLTFLIVTLSSITSHRL